MRRSLRSQLEESSSSISNIQEVTEVDAVSEDPLQSTDSSLGISFGGDASFDDYLVIGVTAMMILVCIVGVYFFTASRSIKYGEDKGLLEDDKKKKKKKTKIAAGGDGEGEYPPTSMKKPKKTTTSSAAKEIKKKMKKKSSGILKTVKEETFTGAEGRGGGDVETGGVTLEDIDNASVRDLRRGKAVVERNVSETASSYNGTGSESNYSSVASSLHDEMLKQTLASVLAGGLTIIQHRPNAEPKPISIALDGAVLRWRSKKLIARHTYSLDLANVTSIEWGKHAVAFAKFNVSDVQDDVCFSLVTEELSLDLQCSSKTERDTLVHGISLMVGDAKSDSANFGDFSSA